MEFARKYYFLAFSLRIPFKTGISIFTTAGSLRESDMASLSFSSWSRTFMANAISRGALHLPQNNAVLDKKLWDYAEAIAFYLDHPEAIKDKVSKAYMDSIRRRLEDPQMQLTEA